jgi:hypothetical protein
VGDADQANGQAAEPKKDSRPVGVSPPSAVAVGDLVQLSGSVSYLKSADPMPMLRPPDLIDSGETGVVVQCRALGLCAVRFRRGTFLLEQSRLKPAGVELPR